MMITIEGQAKSQEKDLHMEVDTTEVVPITEGIKAIPHFSTLTLTLIKTPEAVRNELS